MINVDALQKVTLSDTETQEESENRASKRPKQENFSFTADALRLVFGYLPAYSFVGKRSTHSVCKAVNTDKFKKDIKPKKTREAIMASCQTEDDAINMLSDDVILDHLHFDEYLRLAAFCPALAKDILEVYGDELASLSNGHYLALLCQRDKDLAQQVLANEKWCSKLNLDNLALLGVFLSDIALQILSNPVLRTSLEGRHLVTLGDKKREVIQTIFREEELRNQLDPSQLVSIAKHNHQNVLNILIELPNLLNGSHLADFGEVHEDIAKSILDNTELFEKLSGVDLQRLCRNHPRLIMQILDSPQLYRKLDIISLSILGQSSEVAATKIINTPELVAKLIVLFVSISIYSLIGAHENLSMQYLNTPALCTNLIGSDLRHLGSRHLAPALRIIESKELSDKLSGSDLAELGKSHEKVARRILENPLLLSRLSVKNLATLGSGHQAIGCLIINDLALCNWLIASNTADNLVAICNDQPMVAQHIFKSPKLCALLTSIDLYHMGEIQAAIAKQIVMTEALWRKMDVNHLESLVKYHGPMVAELVVGNPAMCEKLADKNPPVYLDFLKKKVNIAEDIKVKAKALRSFQHPPKRMVTFKI